jgi:hypothetical protein
LEIRRCWSRIAAAYLIAVHAPSSIVAIARLSSSGRQVTAAENGRSPRVEHRLDAIQESV